MKVLTANKRTVKIFQFEEVLNNPLFEKIVSNVTEDCLYIESFGNPKSVEKGIDYVLYDGKCYYPCKIDVFHNTYDHVEGNIYEKKTYTVDCYLYGNSKKGVRRFVGKDRYKLVNGVVMISTLEGWVAVRKGEFIIKSIKGEVYPIDSPTFNQIYKLI